MPTRKEKIEGTHYREIELRAGSVINEEDRTVRVSVSSELPVERSSFFREPWIEVLGHGKDEVDLARLNGGASVLYNHSRDRADRIGVVKSASLANKRIEAVVRISKRDDVNDLWQDIRDGVLKNISVGYTIGERTLTRESKDGPSEFRVTDWQPHEVSFVDIPADPSVGVGRNESGELMYRVIDLGENTMPDKVTNIKDAVNQGVAQERARVSEINDVFSPYPQFEVFRTRAIDDGVTADDARKVLLEEMGRNSSPAGADAYRPGEVSDTRFSMPDRGDDFMQAATDMLAQRYGARIEKPHAGAQDLMGCDTRDIAKLCLGRIGINTARLSPNDIFGRAHTTSDFPLILQNVGSKTALTGYNEAANSHREYTSEAFAKDFKTHFRVSAGQIDDLTLVNEDGEFTYGTMSELGQSVSLATYGKLFAISRQALINDDLGEIMRQMSNAGAAAGRLEADLVTGLLISNPVMQDSVTLFNATHNNVATAAVPSVTSLGEMQTLLRKQKGVGDVAYLDLQPAVIFAPVALEVTIQQILSSIFDPANANNTFNPFGPKSGIKLVVDPRLDDDSATAWYLFTDANRFSWFDRVLLEQQREPFVAMQEGWSVDGTELKIRHDFATIINDFRGAVRNAGV